MKKILIHSRPEILALQGKDEKWPLKINHNQPQFNGRGSRRLILVLLISLFYSLYSSGSILPTAAWGQNFAEKSRKPIVIAPAQNSLPLGEKLEYSLEWLGIPIGVMVLQVEGLVNIADYECYRISSQIIPNGFFRKLYDMEYRVYTYIDRQKLFSRRFEKIRRIKKSLVYVTADFNQENHTAKFTYNSPAGPIETLEFPSLEKKVISDMTETIEIPAEVQDLFSVLYYFRLLNIEENKQYPLQISYERKNWPINIKVDKPFWKDVYKKGSLSLMMVYPDSDLNDLILGKRKISITFTTDSRRIPVEFKLHSTVGLIRGIIKNLPK